MNRKEWPVNSGYFVSVLWKMSDWHKAGDIICLTAGDLHWHASMNSSSLGLGRESRGSMSKVGVEQNRYQEYLRGQDILHFSFEQVQVHGIHVQVQKLLARKAGKILKSVVWYWFMHWHMKYSPHRHQSPSGSCSCPKMLEWLEFSSYRFCRVCQCHQRWVWTS